MTSPADDGALLDALLGPMAEQLRDVNLPLHILLEGRFGELNDNQLEMIHEAQRSARAADGTLRLVRRVRELRAIEPSAGGDLARVVDLLRAPLLQARALAEEQGVVLEVELAPDLPYVRVDRAAVEEGMSVLLEVLVGSAQNGRLRVGASAQPDSVEVHLSAGLESGAPFLMRSLAELLLRRCGARVAGSAQGTAVILPRAELTSA